MNDWIKNLDNESYTDFVLIGGDGLFNQFINACNTHNQSLLWLPIGILPGGSQNALCCDIGGKVPAHATINILRGDSIDADILKASFRKQKKEVLCSIVTWGITGDIVKDSEKYWKFFGRKRYAFSGAKHFLKSLKLKSYDAKIYLRKDEEHVEEELSEEEGDSGNSIVMPEP